jgi:ATP-dependent DNA helicase 2 subunit 2
MPIHQPTARTLAKLDQILPSTEIGDCTWHLSTLRRIFSFNGPDLVLDGIIVGTYVQNEELGKKGSWTRKAVLITDGQNPLEIEEDDIEATVTKLDEWNVELTIM